MRWKILSALLLLSFIVLLTIGVANAADTAYVKATFSVDKTTVVKGQSVTFTCTYTSTASQTGTGRILICGPSESQDFDYLPEVPIHYWNGKTGSDPVLTTEKPVTYTLQLNQTGYYQFKWECNYGITSTSDGAFVTLNVHVVDTLTPLPEAPPLAVFALGFAALGLFIVVTKRRTKTISS